MGCIQSRDKQVDYPAIFTAHSTEEFTIRELEAGDWNKGFFETLKVLRNPSDQSPYKILEEKQFAEVVQNIKESGYIHKILVVEHTKAPSDAHKIVGTGAVFIEPKFIHSGGKVAHIEDVAVHPDFQGKHIGTKIVSALKDIGIAVGSYKVILDTAESNEEFYKKNVQMAHYITEAEVEKLNKELLKEKEKLIPVSAIVPKETTNQTSNPETQEKDTKTNSDQSAQPSQ